MKKKMRPINDVNKKPFVIITGINGFLGSSLALRLQNIYKIIGIEKTISNLSRIEAFVDKIQIYESNAKNLKYIFTNFQIESIIHTATCFGKNGETLTEIAESNYYFPLLLLEYSIYNKVNNYFNIDTVINKYINEYALFKKHFSECLFYYKNKMKIHNVHLEHFYGEGASEANFITYIIKQLINNKREILLTGGEQNRDFIYISDIIEALMLIMENSKHQDEQYSSYHVCTGNKISIRDIVELMKELTGSNSILKFGSIPYREYELMDTNCENSNIIQLGWKPKVSLKEGLIKTIEYLKNN